MTSEEDPELPVDGNRLPFRLRWVRSSPQQVIEAEDKLFKRLSCYLEKLFVPIFGNRWKLRTIIARNFANSCTKGEEMDFAKEKAIPLVMVHGFASGIALWCKNIDSLAQHRRVYAFDLLGFGRSSRPVFPTEAEDAENLFVDSLEEWRTAMNLDKFILLGHSFGGYLSSLYAMKHHERVAHLILVEPWGYQETPFNPEIVPANGWRAGVFRNIRRFIRIPNPLSFIRAAGPLGRSILSFARHDLRDSFEQETPTSTVRTVLEVPSKEDELAFARGALTLDMAGRPAINSSSASLPAHTPRSASDSGSGIAPRDLAGCQSKLLDDDIFDGAAALDYAYHINVQRPSGELAFRTLGSDMAYAKRPLLPRIDALDVSLPVTFIYGSRSWMDVSLGAAVRQLRPNSYVDVKMVEGAGHHVYAQSSEEFNAYLNGVMHHVDLGCEFQPTSRSHPPKPMAKLGATGVFPHSSDLDSDSSLEDLREKVKSPSFAKPLGDGYVAAVVLQKKKTTAGRRGSLSDDAEDEASS